MSKVAERYASPDIITMYIFYKGEILQGSS